VDEFVVVALLVASLLHASWHALVKSTGDRVVAIGGMNAVSCLTAVAILPLANPLPALAYWIIAGSVALHFSYKVALARLYHDADLSQAYPLARGLTPLMAAALAFFAMGESLAPLALAGVALVGVGLALLAFEGSGRNISILSFGVAAAAGLSVAGYSVVDAYGIRMTGDSFSFTIWLVVIDGGTFVAYAIATRSGQVLRTWATGWLRVLITGWLGLASFGVFMWALGRAPVGAVSALRETSVVFSVIIGACILRERVSSIRYMAAGAVAAGVGIIALGR